MSLKIYVHPFLFSIEEQIKIAKEFKLGLELSLLREPENLKKNFEKIAKMLVDARIRISTHLPTREVLLGAFNKSIRTISLERTLKWLRIAKRLKAQWAVLHLNFIDSFYQHVEGKWLEYLMKSLREILREKIPIYLENSEEKGPFIFRRVLEKLSDKVFMCFDIGHAFGYSNTSILRWIDELSPWIKEVHIHETEKGKDLHKPLGSGFMEIEKILRYIDEFVGDYVITLEPVDLKQLENDIKWLRERGFI